MDYAYALLLREELGSLSVYSGWINSKLPKRNNFVAGDTHITCLDDLKTLLLRAEELLQYSQLSDKQLSLLANLVVSCERVKDNFSDVDDYEYMNMIAEIEESKMYYHGREY